MRYFYRHALNSMGKQATAPGGGMDVEGIWKEWGEAETRGIDKVMFVAVLDGEVVGLCGVARGLTGTGVVSERDIDTPPNTFSLWRVSVAPEARNRGIAEKLVYAAEDYARSKVVRAIFDYIIM